MVTKNKKTGGFAALNIRLWRSWITQQIPILKNGGSNPSRRAILGNVLKQCISLYLCGFQVFYGITLSL